MKINAAVYGLVVVLAGAGVALAKKPTSADKKENKEELGNKGKTVATAKLESKSGSKVDGKATFVQNGKLITLRVEVSDAPAGVHAVHLHDKGDCSSPDGKSAGDHWNPTTEAHGKWGEGHHHLGDIGNLTVGADGKGTLTLETDKWTAGDGAPTDIVGHALIVHGGVDDFKTQPTGNAGSRIACAVVKK